MGAMTQDDVIDADGPSVQAARAVCAYIRGACPGLGDDVQLRRFTGGNANLTLLIRIGAREFVVKQEPAGTKARAAHDMRREYRMLEAVSPLYRYAPSPLLLCDDLSITGNVFCVMERIKGEIMRHAGDASAALITARLEGLIDALAQLHAIDVREARLEHLGKMDGYRERQVTGWIERWRVAQTGSVAQGDDVVAWLESRRPTAPQLGAIVHNDFKMDNLVWDNRHPARLAGVLDWEMATIGDPLMDFANSLAFWIENSDPAPLRALRSMPGSGPGLPTRHDALRRYEKVTGRHFDDYPFYRCFGLFRRAVIEQQKYRRFATGQSDDLRYAHLDEAVTTLIGECRAIIGSN